jgi:hypothetical protein
MDDHVVHWKEFAARAEQQPPAEVLLTIRIELMTCITIVRGFTDLAEMGEGESLSAMPQEWVDAMRRATDHMQWMLNMVMLPLIQRLMPDDEPKRKMIEAMMRQVLESENQ